MIATTAAIAATATPAIVPSDQPWFEPPNDLASLSVGLAEEDDEMLDDAKYGDNDAAVKMLEITELEMELLGGCGPLNTPSMQRR